MAEQSILTVISRQSKTKGEQMMKIDRLVRVTKKRIATVHRQPSWMGAWFEKKEILKWAAAGAALGSIVPVIEPELAQLLVGL